VSRRYREGDRAPCGPESHPQVPERALNSAEEVVAYAVSSMPATYAASRAALHAFATVPNGAGLAPRTVLDLGGGLGAAAYAAAATWPTVEEVTIVDQEPLMLAAGRDLRAIVGDAAPQTTWEKRDLARSVSSSAP